MHTQDKAVNQPFVCKQEDNFTYENPRWLTKLNNNEIILADDGRPDTFPPSAWSRLKLYIYKNDLNIDQFYLQFRSNIVRPLPDFAEGYYFSKWAACSMHSPFTDTGFILGYIDGDKIYTTLFCVPAFIVMRKETFFLNEAKEHNVIMNTGRRRQCTPVTETGFRPTQENNFGL